MKLNYKDIKLNPDNPRLIKDDKFKKLVLSIKEDPDFLDAREVIVNKKHIILGGNMRYKAAIEAGMKEIPVKIVDWDENKQKRFVIKDNVSGGEWDWDLLANQYEPLELEQWGLDLPGGFVQEEVEEDETPEVSSEPPVSKLGEIYQLGRHRVMCGDSTDFGTVTDLMDGKLADCVVTDPPYNTGMEEKSDKTTRLSYMFNDKIENWDEFLEDTFSNYYTVTKGECAFYVFIDWRRVSDIKKASESKMDVKNVIVWDKGVHGLGSDYKFTYELCVVGKKGKPQINNRIGLDYQDIWRVQRTMGRNTDHATAKPIELLVKPINHASKVDDIVLDLFLGSGSTLIACEQTDRICYGMELDPKYVDVIRKRYAKFIGKEEEWQTITPKIK